MTGTLSEEALYYVVGCTPARDVWNSFKENLLPVTEDRKGQLEQQMQDMRLGSQSLSEFLKSFKKVFDGLSAIQKPVLDDNEIIYLSRGLGEKYNVLVTSLLSKPPFPSYSQFVTAVQSCDLRLQSMTPVPQHPNPNMAFLASRPSGGRGGHGTALVLTFHMLEIV